MEYHFEIVGTETLELYKQLYRKVLRTGSIIIACIWGAAALMSLWHGIVYGDGVRTVTACVYVLVAVLMVSWYPAWTAKRAYRAKLKYHNGAIPQDTVRFGDELVIEAVDSIQKIPYDKITKIHYTKNGIVFAMGRHRAIAIPNEQFTRGSMQELKAFLRQKCPNLKNPE